MYLALLGLSWKGLAFSVRRFVAIRVRRNAFFLFNIGDAGLVVRRLKKKEGCLCVMSIVIVPFGVRSTAESRRGESSSLARRLETRRGLESTSWKKQLANCRHSVQGRIE